MTAASPSTSRIRRACLCLMAYLALPATSLLAQDSSDDKFRQLEEILPSPTVYRTASGAPGPQYWQQRADYVIDAELDDVEQRLTGSETVIYSNHSPDTLRYLWLQLDPNLYADDAAGLLVAKIPDFDEFAYKKLRRLLALEKFDGGVEIHRLVDGAGQPLDYTVVKTMLRLDLPTPLEPGQQLTFQVDWSFAINDAVDIGGRSGWEFFDDDGNYLYEIAQWFPRVAAYTDVNGWQHKQFIGNGEFTLELGDYLVRLTVPEDHVVAATGELQNPEEVLSEVQRQRLKRAWQASQPVFIVTPEEAKANERTPASGKKTWIYRAENVRDFAFTSSRKFIWDAQGHQVDDQRVLAMSLYPNEAEPLWSRFSTASIIHTLDVYSRYTFTYPYPVAISVNGPVGGMEYPMICFNGPRPYEDGTYWDKKRGDKYWRRSKYGLISVIIHEVGHNYFPMIVNSDERQWTWMDEGLNTFLQYLAEQEWEEKYPSRRGEPKDIVEYMTSDNQVPIMTNSESLLQFGNNAYAKPATALNILRETVLGRELFDFAFREYARRWRFKRPMPADLFRTMEDASGIDLDWFWRGWFYTTDHVDLAINEVREYTLETYNAEIDKGRLRAEREAEPQTLSRERNQPLSKRVDREPRLKDFYNDWDELEVSDWDREHFKKQLAGLELEDWERNLLDTEHHVYVVKLDNLGGLVMPVILAITFEDGSEQELRIPAEIWRRHADHVDQLLLTRKAVRSIVLDPHWETADTDIENNYFPRRVVKSRFQLFKEDEHSTPNPMRQAGQGEGTKKKGDG